MKKVIIERGDIVKIWKKGFGGTGHDYVVLGKWNASDSRNPLLIIIKKTNINNNGSLHKRAKFFLLPASHIKAIVGKMNIDPFLTQWYDGQIAAQTAKRVTISFS